MKKGIIRERLYNLLHKMLLIITKRAIVSRLEKMRWESIDEDRLISPSTRRHTTFKRMYEGVIKEDFEQKLFREEFYCKSKIGKAIIYINDKIRPKYLPQFKPTVLDTIDTCISKGYIQVIPTKDKYFSTNNPELPIYEYEDIRYKVSEEGKKLISKFYYIKSLYTNHHIQLAISTLIQWGVPVIALWLLSLLFNINIEPK